MTYERASRLPHISRVGAGPMAMRLAAYIRNLSKRRHTSLFILQRRHTRMKEPQDSLMSLGAWGRVGAGTTAMRFAPQNRNPSKRRHTTLFNADTHKFSTPSLYQLIHHNSEEPHTSTREATSINQSIKGPYKATHGQGEATSWHHHREQQTLRHQVKQAWGAVNESQPHLTCATHSLSTQFAVACPSTAARGNTPCSYPLYPQPGNAQTHASSEAVLQVPQQTL